MFKFVVMEEANIVRLQKDEVVGIWRLSVWMEQCTGVTRDRSELKTREAFAETAEEFTTMVSYRTVVPAQAGGGDGFKSGKQDLLPDHQGLDGCEAENGSENEKLLVGREATLYRAIAARINFSAPNVQTYKLVRRRPVGRWQPPMKETGSS